MQQDVPASTSSRPSFVSGPAWPLGLSLLLSAAARDASLGLLQGSLGLAASGLFVAGRELIGLGLFIPATMTRLIPGMGLLLGPTPQPQLTAAAQLPQVQQLQTRVRFTHTHGVEPLKAIHHHQHHQRPAPRGAGAATNKQQQPQHDAWTAALPAGPQQQPWTHLVALAQQHQHHSKDASRVRQQQQRLAQRMHQGKALFRLPPVLPVAHHHLATATMATSASGWVITTSTSAANANSNSSQTASAAGPKCVLSRCPSSLAVRTAPLQPLTSATTGACLVRTNGGASLSGQQQRGGRAPPRGALAAGPVASEDEEWLPLTHLALRSSLL